MNDYIQLSFFDTSEPEQVEKIHGLFTLEELLKIEANEGIYTSVKFKLYRQRLVDDNYENFKKFYNEHVRCEYHGHTVADRHRPLWYVQRQGEEVRYQFKKFKDYTTTSTRLCRQTYKEASRDDYVTDNDVEWLIRDTKRCLNHDYFKSLWYMLQINLEELEMIRNRDQLSKVIPVHDKQISEHFAEMRKKRKEEIEKAMRGCGLNVAEQIRT